MRTLKIDSFDKGFAICTDKEKSYFAIELGELPKGVKKGDIIEIDDNGKMKIKNSKSR